MRLKHQVWLLIAIFIAEGIIVTALTLAVKLESDTAIALAAFLTSVTTAAYTVLVEAMQKKHPLLRIEPMLTGGAGMGTLSFELALTNLPGSATARDLQVECRLIGAQTVSLVSDGHYRIALLGSGEKARIAVAENVATPIMMAQQSYEVKVQYRDEEGEDMKPLQIRGSIKELDEVLRRAILRRSFH